MTALQQKESYRPLPQVYLPGGMSRVQHTEIIHRAGEHAISSDALSLHAQSLIEEVARVKEQERESGREGKDPWYHLSRTGFFVKGQVELFLKDIQEEMAKGKDFTHAIDFSSVKIEEDIKGFEYEYLKQLAGLQWNIGWRTVNGVQKLCGTDYNDALLDDLTSSKEREGALRDAWFVDKPGKPGIESWLRTAPVGSKVLLVSPSGWSGYDEFTYPQTQIYYVEVGKDDALTSFTLRYDVSIKQNEQLQKTLGVNVLDMWNERDRIKQMLGSPIFIAPNGAPIGNPTSRKVNSPEDVIDLMQEVAGSQIAFSDERFGERTFSQMRAFVKDPDRFLERHPQAEELTKTFQEFVHWEFSQGHSQEETTQNLEIALALVIVHLKGLYLGSAEERGRQESREMLVYTKPKQMPSAHVVGGMFQKKNLNYQKELEDIQKLPGCAGGGSKVRINSLGSSREAQTSLKAGDTLTKECPGCHQVVTATIDDECRIICPNDEIPCQYSLAGRTGRSRGREGRVEDEEKPKKQEPSRASKDAKKKPVSKPEKVTPILKAKEQGIPEYKKRRGGEHEQQKTI